MLLEGIEKVTEWMASGRLFHTWFACMGRHQMPGLVRGTIRLWVADDCRRCREMLSAAQCKSFGRYASSVWLRQRKTSSQNFIHSVTLSQCRSCSNGVTWSYFRLLCINLAAALSTDWSRVWEYPQEWHCHSPVATIPVTSRATARLVCWPEHQQQHRVLSRLWNCQC